MEPRSPLSECSSSGSAAGHASCPSAPLGPAGAYAGAAERPARVGEARGRRVDPHPRPRRLRRRRGRGAWRRGRAALTPPAEAGGGFAPCTSAGGQPGGVGVGVSRAARTSRLGRLGRRRGLTPRQTHPRHWTIAGRFWLSQTDSAVAAGSLRDRPWSGPGES